MVLERVSCFHNWLCMKILLPHVCLRIVMSFYALLTWIWIETYLPLGLIWIGIETYLPLGLVRLRCTHDGAEVFLSLQKTIKDCLQLQSFRIHDKV